REWRGRVFVCRGRDGCSYDGAQVGDHGFPGLFRFAYHHVLAVFGDPRSQVGFVDVRVLHHVPSGAAGALPRDDAPGGAAQRVGGVGARLQHCYLLGFGRARVDQGTHVHILRHLHRGSAGVDLHVADDPAETEDAAGTAVPVVAGDIPVSGDVGDPPRFKLPALWRVLSGFAVVEADGAAVPNRLPHRGE